MASEKKGSTSVGWTASQPSAPLSDQHTSYQPVAQQQMAQGVAPAPPPPQQETYYTGQQEYHNEPPPSYQSSAFPPMSGGNDYYAPSFAEKSIRRAFVMKVYIILTAQLAVTIGLVCIMYFIPAVNNFVRHSTPMYISSYIVFLVTFLVIMCCPTIRKKVPHNYIALTIFTLALAYMIGVLSCHFRIDAVLIAFGITAIVTLGVSLFACQTKLDLTLLNGLLFCLCMVLFTFGFFMIFMWSRVLHLIYASIGALLFTLFLAYDTQIIMGGKRCELDPEEYIFAALTLYTDILYIFIFILSIFGSSN